MYTTSLYFAALCLLKGAVIDRVSVDQTDQGFKKCTFYLAGMSQEYYEDLTDIFFKKEGVLKVDVVAFCDAIKEARRHMVGCP